MRKKLELELMSIAHRILKLKGSDDVDKLHVEVAQLYEKLTVLKFAKDMFEEDKPSIGNDSSFFEMLNTAFNNRVSDTVEIENKTYVNVDEVEDDGIVEPVMEKIKDMVAQMPHEADAIDNVVKKATSQPPTNEVYFESISSDFENIPKFDPVTTHNSNLENNIKKSLNDKLKRNVLQIGLNDKLAFIKHLFEGKSEDYHRVVSQINTSASLEDARTFIENLVKPDYNHWEGREDYETRFIEIIEAKFA